jgi:predicted S18 family serine protease
MATCIHYNYSLYELFFPSYKIFEKFCSSSEKTTLFAISALRLFIIYRLYHVFNNLQNFYGKNELSWTFFVYLLINLIYLIIIFFKTPDYDQIEMEQEAEGIALALEENTIEKSQYYKAQQEAKPVIES